MINPNRKTSPPPAFFRVGRQVPTTGTTTPLSSPPPLSSSQPALDGTCTPSPFSVVTDTPTAAHLQKTSGSMGNKEGAPSPVIKQELLVDIPQEPNSVRLKQAPTLLNINNQATSTVGTPSPSSTVVTAKRKADDSDIPRPMVPYYFNRKRLAMEKAAGLSDLKLRRLGHIIRHHYKITNTPKKKSPFNAAIHKPIIKSLLDHCCPNTRLSLRGVSRDYSREVDSYLGQHVKIEPAPNAQDDPMEDVTQDLLNSPTPQPLVMQPPPTRSIEPLRAVPMKISLYNIRPRLSFIYSEPNGIQFDDDDGNMSSMSFSLLARTRLVDIIGRLYYVMPYPDVMLPLSDVETVRIFHTGRSHHGPLTYNTPRYYNIASSKLVIICGSGWSNEMELQGKVVVMPEVSKIVLTLKYSQQYPMTSIVGLTCPPPVSGVLKPIEIVVLIERSWRVQPGKESWHTPDPPKINLLGIKRALLSVVENYRPGITFKIVGIEQLSNYWLGLPSDLATEHVIEDILASVRFANTLHMFRDRTWGGIHGRLTDALNATRFITFEEYASSLKEGELDVECGK